jgi:3-deoxy-D-manno-octulosonic-acid transferase
MLGLYSLLLTAAMLLMSPLFLLRREKYASGFRERLGNYPEFKHDRRKVIWLHCVSVGETNAARPLVDELIQQFPLYRIVISTTTQTGQELAQNIFRDKADRVFYFPFDWKFSVCRALRTFKPSLVLLMETEIWPRLIVEAKRSVSEVAIVNGRLSQRSLDRYSSVRPIVSRVLRSVDLALMQNTKDAERIEALGIDANKVRVTGNLKFDLSSSEDEIELTERLKDRFQFDGSRPLIVAASTHDPEERWIVESLKENLAHDARLLIAPRHPERFQIVSNLLKDSGQRFVRRSDEPSERDRSADIVLLDSIGELRAVFPLAEIVFVAGSLIPHGGQSILEPASAGVAIVTGHYTQNFNDAVKLFRADGALIQLPESSDENVIVAMLSAAFDDLLHSPNKRQDQGSKASALMKANRGATAKTVAELKLLIDAK